MDRSKFFKFFTYSLHFCLCDKLIDRPSVSGLSVIKFYIRVEPVRQPGDIKIFLDSVDTLLSNISPGECVRDVHSQELKFFSFVL